jgi:hypothetical protein
LQLAKKKEDQAMPVLDERKAAPRSAVRYQPTDQKRAPGRTLARGGPSRPETGTSAVRVTAQDQDTATRGKQRPPVPRRGAAARQEKPAGTSSRRPPPSFFVVLGLLLTILLWSGLTQLITWGSGVLDLVRYGNPRTYQIDAVVGQGDSAQHPSHFLALNLHGQVVIVEFPAGNPARAREFLLPGILGANADQVVVTLRFLDVAHNGSPDMIIDAGSVRTFLVNAAGTFRPPTAGEQQQILAFLQHSR